MGKILSYKHGEGSVKGLDPRLWDIAQASIAAMPYDAQIRSAAERGKGDKGNHSGGYAIDVTFFDQNGNRIPDTGKTGGVNSAVIYEQWAKTARAIQQEKYPELNKTFRWGGGFRQGYPFDFMHLDITPSRGGSMAYYNWDTGWNSEAYSALPGLKEASGKPVPPLGLNNEVFPVTASRQIDQQRMQFDARLQNTPLPRPRPETPARLGTTVAGRPDAPFRDTGLPAAPAAPQPATMSPALAAARQRLTAARLAKTGVTTPEAMAATPRITDTDAEAAARRPPLEWGQFKPAVTAGGRGSLLEGINPATPNPPKPPVAGLRLPTSPTTVAGRPEAPVGSMPAAAQGKPDPIKAPTSVASGPAAGRPGGATSVPGNGGKVDNGSQANAAATPQTREPQYVTINGKRAQVGQSFVQGDRLMIVDVDASGKGVIRDVTDVRDDFLRKNVDPNAPLLFEKSLAGDVARGVAGPVIKGKLAEVGGSAREALGNTLGGITRTAGELATQARDSIGTMFSTKGAAKAPAGNTLVAGRPQAPVGALPAAKPIATSIVNPEYTAWVKKYGTGRVNPAAVESLEDIHDRQASALGYGAIPPVPQNRPPAPPKMITVAKPGNTVSRPSAPAQAAPAKPATTIVQIGGYLYDSSQKAANGGLLKVGKVGSSSSSSSGAGNTLTVAPRPSSSTTVKPAAPSTSTGRGITGNSSFASWAFG